MTKTTDESKIKNSKNSPAIHWFRQDLRLADNPALSEAVACGGAVYCLYIMCDEEEAPWAPGGASKVWLHFSLTALKADLEAIGGQLHFFKCGKGEKFRSTKACLEAVIKETGAQSIYWNRRYEPAIIERDTELKAHFKEKGLLVETSNSALLQEPWQMKTKEGNPFQVFTPYWKACLNQMDVEPPVKPPEAIESGKKQLTDSCTLKQLDLLPKIHWDGGIKESWQQGEEAALKILKDFLNKKSHDYPAARDIPQKEGVSRLSPYLHFGEISPRTIWYETKAHAAKHREKAEPCAQFLRELGWREFSHHLLFHFPQTTTEPLRKDFQRFPWKNDKELLHAWQRGQTGYPIVDAGMRELWHTGIMHNRVRMITASFLVKHLLQPWQAGAEWFWDTLVDADLAQNTMGWQWTAGCGADAAPYFRIFNPILQGEKFDGDGVYVKKWVPELAKLPKKFIHQPWTADKATLTAAGITLGKDYPLPIVEHTEARGAALAAFQKLKAEAPATA